MNKANLQEIEASVREALKGVEVPWGIEYECGVHSFQVRCSLQHKTRGEEFFVFLRFLNDYTYSLRIAYDHIELTPQVARLINDLHASQASSTLNVFVSESGYLTVRQCGRFYAEDYAGLFAHESLRQVFDLVEKPEFQELLALTTK